MSGRIFFGDEDQTQEEMDIRNKEINRQIREAKELGIFFFPSRPNFEATVDSNGTTVIL